MPSVRVRSPLSPGAPVALHYRDSGSGAPLLILHGGFGYGFYPFDAQLAELERDFRCLIPDRTGYGASPHLAALPPRFHEAAALESEAFLAALGLERCALWGHSDGAVIALWMALRRPEGCTALVLEALHVEREKPRSRSFFTTMAENPDALGARVAARLAADHGHDWRAVVRAGGRAWLDIAATPDADLYDGRLHELRVPTLLVHGTEDPRTEPGELERVLAEVPHARLHWIAGGGHSPHSEPAVAAETTRSAAAFLRSHR